MLSRLINPFPLPSFNVIDGVTLSLMPGETLGLVGESGSGKTTLARTILGLVRAAAGRIAFEGRDVATPADFRAMRRRSAMMFQDPVASLSPRLRIGTLLTEPQIIQGVPMPDRRAAAKALLALVGLPASFVDRFPHELSGGQARRVGVARALAMKPHLLLADEPTAGLDVSVQGDVLNLIGELKRELGFAAMIVTHNLAMIRHVSDRLAIMYLGRLVETGTDAGRVLGADASLHRDADPVRADTRSAPAQPQSCRQRRDPERVPAAFGLRVPHALPDRARPLPDRGTGLSADRPGADGALPFPAARQAGKNGKPSHALPPTKGETDMTQWNIDRRAFLKAAGALGAGLTMKPGFAWSADGDTLRIRMEGDLQTLDPAFMIGGIEDVMMRGIYVSLNRLGDLREGSPWSLWGAEKLEQKDPKSIAFTLIDGLKWSNGFGPVTAEDVKFSYRAHRRSEAGVALGLPVREARPRRGRRCQIRHHPPQGPVPADLRRPACPTMAAISSAGPAPKRPAASSPPSRRRPAVPISSRTGSRSRR